MDPWYFLDGFDYKVKDGNDNRFELYDLLEVYANGSWYVFEEVDAPHTQFGMTSEEPQRLNRISYNMLLPGGESVAIWVGCRSVGTASELAVIPTAPNYEYDNSGGGGAA